MSESRRRDKGQDVENQRQQLRQLCDANQWKIAAEYEDHDSGGKSNRAGFRRMFEDARQRRFDVLIFWALDRFSREGVTETLNYLQRGAVRQDRSHGCEVLQMCNSEKQALSMNDPWAYHDKSEEVKTVLETWIRCLVRLAKSVELGHQLLRHEKEFGLYARKWRIQGSQCWPLATSPSAD